MELLSRRRWTTGLAQQLKINEILRSMWCIIFVGFDINTAAYHFGQFLLFTKELHGTTKEYKLPLGLQQSPSVTHWPSGATLLQLGTSLRHGLGSVSSNAQMAASAESGGRHPSVGEQQRLAPKQRWSVNGALMRRKRLRRFSSPKWSSLESGSLPQGAHCKQFYYREWLTQFRQRIWLTSSRALV